MARGTPNHSTTDKKDGQNKVGEGEYQNMIILRRLQTKSRTAVTASSKRKLSLGEPQKVLKKAKKASDEEAGAHKGEKGDNSSGDDKVSLGDEDKGGSDEDKDEEVEDNGDEEEDDEGSDDLNGKAYKIDGPGPYVFFLWADAIYGLLDLGPADDIPYVVLKSAATDAFAPVASLPEDDVHEAIEDHLELVKTWMISPVEGADKTPQAEVLKKTWKKLTAESHARKESESDAGWWYEVLAQKEKPEVGHAGIEVELEDAGTWWFADIQPTDEHGHKAMSCIVNYTAHAYD